MSWSAACPSTQTFSVEKCGFHLAEKGKLRPSGLPRSRCGGPAEEGFNDSMAAVMRSPVRHQPCPLRAARPIRSSCQIRFHDRHRAGTRWFRRDAHGSSPSCGCARRSGAGGLKPFRVPGRGLRRGCGCRDCPASKVASGAARGVASALLLS